MLSQAGLARKTNMGMADMRMVNGGLKTLAALALTVLTAAGSGCASKVSEEARAIPVEPGPYPDFSRPLNSAMEQMTDEDAKTMETQLTALAGQRRAGAISEAEYLRRVEELRALGKTTATN
ncbi:SHOCT domain-containing protein [Rhizobium sp. FKL33]|uniref:SHOCT domain-containing protein n=1 Tax=Rhizobium sp. FKL33 TaxID=2562307 RepID=UPI0010BF8957|nr:SHOCT domain-containing protein [Rhizobium sp. FKL33]